MNSKTVVMEIEFRFRRVAEALCCNPGALELFVDALPFGAGFLVRLRADRGDTGRLVGKGGATFEALALCAKRVGARHDTFIKLARVMEPVIGVKDEFVFEPNGGWPDGREEFRAVIGDVCRLLFGGDPVVRLEDFDGEARDESDALRTTAVCQVRLVGRRTGPVDALRLLADAIGRDYGRLVAVAVEQDSPEASQPKSAAGRHSGEVDS